MGSINTNSGAVKHSKNYAKIKRYYDNGIWTKGMLKLIVGTKSGITANGYKEITGEDFEL